MTPEQRRGFYAGSFDPPTLAHIDIALRARQLCDSLVIAVGSNPTKTPLLSDAQRIDLLRTCVKDADIEVVSYQGGTLAAARAHNATLLIRGLRHGQDVDHEHPRAECHRRQGLETIALFSRYDQAFISSTLARELLLAGHGLDHVVPTVVAEALRNTVP